MTESHHSTRTVLKGLRFDPALHVKRVVERDGLVGDSQGRHNGIYHRVRRSQCLTNWKSPDRCPGGATGHWPNSHLIRSSSSIAYLGSLTAQPIGASSPLLALSCRQNGRSDPWVNVHASSLILAAVTFSSARPPNTGFPNRLLLDRRPYPRFPGERGPDTACAACGSQL